MTDQEIIKALECCVTHYHIEDCAKCPIYEKKGTCVNVLLEKSLDIITHQQAEIEEFEIVAGMRNNRKYYKKFVEEVFQKEKGNKLTYPDFDHIYKLYFGQKAEIERLTEENKKLRLEMSYMSKPDTIGDAHEIGCW